MYIKSIAATLPASHSQIQCLPSSPFIFAIVSAYCQQQLQQPRTLSLVCLVHSGPKLAHAGYLFQKH